MQSSHADEVSKGDRFQFGSNWKSFLSTLDDERIREAERSLAELLNTEDLSGKTFLDIGSGSGLSSLAARRLGAVVYSFDFDPESVGCTKELKRRYFCDDTDWTIDEGSALDEEYVSSLGKFDIVYSWGVLHHTGQMWKAINNAILPVAETGTLFISIYNDQGYRSKIWTKVKKLYSANRVGRLLVNTTFIPIFWLQSVGVGLIKHGNPLAHFSAYKAGRGMSIYHDWIDWLGGYPFEVATPHEILKLGRGHGFVLSNLTTSNGHGCNQFVFHR